MMPTASRTALSDTCDAISQPKAMPITAPGSRIFKFDASQSRR